MNFNVLDSFHAQFLGVSSLDVPVSWLSGAFPSRFDSWRSTHGNWQGGSLWKFSMMGWVKHPSFKSCSKCLIYILDSKMACFGSPKHFFSFCIQTFLCPVQQQHEKPNLTDLAPHDGRRWRQQNLHLPTIARRRALMDLLDLPCMRYALVL